MAVFSFLFYIGGVWRGEEGHDLRVWRVTAIIAIPYTTKRNNGSERNAAQHQIGRIVAMRDRHT